MKRLERIDRIPIKLDAKTIERDERGYARVWGSVVPVNALLTYGRADGYDTDEHVEFVPEATVSDPEAIASLLFSPITMPHPPEMLDASNTARFQIGTVIDAKVEDGELRALHQFTDSTALDRVAGGIVELSPGYTAEIDETPGTFEGQPYAAVQRNRRYNHQAVVDQARAGSANRLFIDSKRAESGLRIQVRKDEETHTMAEVTIDEKTFEVADEVAAELLRLQEAAANTDQNGEEEEEQPSRDADDEEVAADSEGAAPAAAPQGSPDAAPQQVSSTPESLSATVEVSTGGKKDSYAKLLSRLDGLEDRVAAKLEAKEKAKADAAAKAQTAADKAYADARSALPGNYDPAGKSATKILRDAVVARNPDLKAKADAAMKSPAKLRGMFEAEMSHPARQDSHPLGDKVPDGQPKDKWRMRVDAAREVHRTHKLLGSEAMRHESVVSAGAN